MKILQMANLAELPQVAGQLKELIDASEKNIVAFYGEMGAGKTTLIKELCKLWGVTDNTGSPTFALVNEYHTEEGKILYHFDFYRINRLDEVYDLGYEEYFYSDNVCLIEWPEKVETLLPDEAIKVNITVLPDGERRIQVQE